MQSLKNFFGSLIITLLFCCSVFAKTYSTPSIEAIWNHHIAAWNKRDVKAITDDYSENSVVVVNNNLYKGKKEIEDLFLKLFSTFDKATEHQIDEAVIIGKIIYITWRAKIDGIYYPLGTDTFVVENGYIAYQTITVNPVFPN